MVKKLTTKDYKIRALFLKEWEAKTKPSDAAKMINSKFGERSITSVKVSHQFKRFNKGDTAIFDKYSQLHVSLPKNKKSTNGIKNSLNSLLSIDEPFDGYAELLYKEDGRFLFFLSYKCVTIYDLLKNVKRKNNVSFCFSRRNVAIVGDYLLHVSSNYDNTIKIFKINYIDLTLEEPKTISTGDSYYHEILSDQLDRQKILIWNCRNIRNGKLQNDEIIWSDVKNIWTFDFSIWQNKRLVGNKIQGFIPNTPINVMKFHEIDLDIKVTREINAPVKLGNKNVPVFGFQFYYCCWANDDRYYAMFEGKNGQHNLLVLDVKTFNWSNTKILVNGPLFMSVDLNETLTLHVGDYRNATATYRISLRKPDTLFNLTWTSAVRESTLYSNDKYLQAICQLPI